MFHLNLHRYLAPLPVLSAALLASLGCDHAGRTAPAPAPFTREGERIKVGEDSPLRRSLQVQTIQAQQVQDGLAVPAAVEADPSELVKILPPVSGRVAQLQVHLGDWVRKGQVLATLESADLAQAFADLQKAGAQRQQAQRSLERVRELNGHEIASRKELEQAETDWVAADSEWKRARSHVQQLGAAPEGGSNHLLALRAPIAGRISELNAGAGGYWNDLNAPLMTVANLTKVWFSASVQEKDIAKVYVGQPVLANAAGFPQETFQSKVAFVGAMLEPETRTVKVRMVFDNPGHRLLPAMFATVTFRLRPHSGLLVPTSALVQTQEGARVYVEVQPWTFEARAVKAGAQIGAATEILEGLKAGERVAGKEGVIFND